jgi:hypothetical protein
VPEKNGEPDAVIEISPLFATSAAQLAERTIGSKHIQKGESLYFGDVTESVK